MNEPIDEFETITAGPVCDPKNQEECESCQ